MRALRRGISVIVFALAAATAWLFWSLPQPAASPDDPAALQGRPPAALVAQGRYLIRVGNCAGCHTTPGGRPFAGGLALESDFGTFHTPNITPDPDTGIGDWSEPQFWRAMHRGIRADGSRLYPACPYPSFTRVTRADVDAIYAYLRTVKPVRHRTPAHDLDFPYSVRPLLAVWQALYFRPETYQPDPGRGKQWNRGRYLVEGLGHCDECHRQRNAMGAKRSSPSAPGGMVHHWYAPSLGSPAEAGLQSLDIMQAAMLLRSGRSGDTVMMGPMADVVFQSLQHLSRDDARAMAAYLTSIPETAVAGARRGATDSPAELKRTLALGKRIYDNGCSDCHGDAGRGSEGVAALAGNRGVMLDNPVNVINMIREGGFPAAVPGDPRPYGMPPHYNLSRQEIAAVATYIRRRWGNQARPVTTIDVAE